MLHDVVGGRPFTAFSAHSVLRKSLIPNSLTRISLFGGILGINCYFLLVKTNICNLLLTSEHWAFSLHRRWYVFSSLLCYTICSYLFNCFLLPSRLQPYISLIIAKTSWLIDQNMSRKPRSVASQLDNHWTKFTLSLRFSLSHRTPWGLILSSKSQ